MKIKVIILTLIILIISLNPIEVSSYTENVMFDKISIDDGLSNEYVTEIFNDSQGYIWIGTKDGLNRFNGKDIKIYNRYNNNDNSLSSTNITAIEEDYNGNIWIGTDDGLDILLRDSDSILRFKELDNDGKILGNLKITSLLNNVHEKNIMWVGTENGLMRVDIETLSIKKIYNEYKDENKLKSSYITCLKEAKDGTIWVGTTSGVNAIDKNTNVIKSNKDIYNNNSYINSIEEDKKGFIHISSKNGILVYDMATDNYQLTCSINQGEIRIYNINTNTLELIHKQEKNYYLHETNFILSDSDNNIWISTSGGLVKFSNDSENYSFFEGDIGNERSLSSNYINCLYEDNNGIIWVGTEKGVNILNIKNKFVSTNKMESQYGSSYGDNIVSIIQNNKYLWIATKFSGIYIYDIESKEIVYRLYDKENLNLSNKHIKGLVKINDRYTTCITNKEIITFDVYNKTMKEDLPLEGYSEEYEYIYSDNEMVWVSSTTDFFVHDISSGEVTSYKDELKKLNINLGAIKYIVSDLNDKNILWMGGVNTGILKYHKDEGFIGQYVRDSFDEENLISNYINCMAFDSKGDLWIGTNIGLSKFNIANEEFTSYTVANGLTNNFINAILIDDNNLWVSTNKGLNKINVESNEIINFTEKDGIVGYQFTLNSAIKTNRGNMLFGSTNGITYFDPDEIELPKIRKSKIQIGDIYIGDSRVVYDGKALVLEYNNRDIYMDFFLPDYTNLGSITYEYMIKGLDSKWVYIDTKNDISIKSLNPGKYTLMIRARGGNGNLTEAISVNLTVKNPFWRTPIAYIIYIIILLALIIYILNYVKILRKLVQQKTISLNRQLVENERLSKEIIEKEKFKNNYFVNLSHELRTPINVISSTTQLINSINKKSVLAKEKLDQYMKIIDKNCDNLLRIINDIIDSSKLETGTYKITKKNADIVYVVEEIVLSMSKFIEEKGLSLIIDPDMEEKVISFDVVEIERCVINLLGNAVKFTPEGGEIRVYIKEVNDSIEIIVEDTGIGISQEDQEFIFNRFSQVEGTGVTKASSSGIGLTLVKYITKLHGGYVRLESEVNKGSRFTIGLPNIIDNTI